MYRCSSKSSPLDLFSRVSSHLKGKELKVYEDSQKWHNLFRVQVTNRIDEGIFRPLFDKNFGAPNASIRILIAMMILKEARGWSDSQLFEECAYNLLVRSALGLFNMNDSIPVPSTYYISASLNNRLLRNKIVIHENKTYENLIEKAFAQVTKSQALEFKINGNKIRMDSKLIGSNIAWYSRYELIHETLRRAYLSAKPQIDRLLNEAELSLLKCISGESGDKVSYRSTRSEIETKLSQLGQVIYMIINGIKDSSSEALETLRCVFNDQYQVVQDAVIVRPKQEISAASVQSPHDTDCQYRQKDEQQIKGYSVNVTETCDPHDTLNLVTNVLVDTAGAADCEFLQTAIEVTKGIVSGSIETANADGAYHSPENQDYCKENEIDLVLSAIQGKTSRYDLTMDETGEVIVTDLQTNTIVSSRKIVSHKKEDNPKWAILNDKKQYRYFTQKDIDTCFLRKQLAVRTPEELNLRNNISTTLNNNVEATIFQLGYHYPNAKSRYRGLIKHKMWANLRCFWINFVRIANFVSGNSPNYAKKSANCLILPRLCAPNVKIELTLSRLLHFITKWSDDIYLFFGHQKIYSAICLKSQPIIVNIS